MCLLSAEIEGVYHHILLAFSNSEREFKRKQISRVNVVFLSRSALGCAVLGGLGLVSTGYTGVAILLLEAHFLWFGS